MARPVWRDVLEQTQLGPEEQAECLRPGRPGDRRTHRLWGRIAAKEAARRLWLAGGRSAALPGRPGDRRGPTVDRDSATWHDPSENDLPAISIAHAEGVVVALAARDPETHAGIDVEPVCEWTDGVRPLALSNAEASWSIRCEDIAMRVDRPVSGGQAGGGQGSGLSLAAARAVAEVVAAEVDTGEVFVLLQGGLGSEPPVLAGATIRVNTARRGDHVWAWTLGEEG